MQLEDFFEKVNNRENLDRENVFESKERFFNYLDDIFSSTFKLLNMKAQNLRKILKRAITIRKF